MRTLEYSIEQPLLARNTRSLGKSLMIASAVMAVLLLSAAFMSHFNPQENNIGWIASLTLSGALFLAGFYIAQTTADPWRQAVRVQFSAAELIVVQPDGSRMSAAWDALEMIEEELLEGQEQRTPFPVHETLQVWPQSVAFTKAVQSSAYRFLTVRVQGEDFLVPIPEKLLDEAVLCLLQHVDLRKLVLKHRAEMEVDPVAGNWRKVLWSFYALIPVTLVCEALRRLYEFTAYGKMWTVLFLLSGAGVLLTLLALISRFVYTTLEAEHTVWPREFVYHRWHKIATATLFVIIVVLLMFIV